MRIGRTIIIPVILALSAAGSIVAGSAAPAMAAPSHATHLQTVVSSQGTSIFYHA
jgi:hypothetical protein